MSAEDVVAKGRVLARFWRQDASRTTMGYGFHMPAGLKPQDIPHGTELVAAEALTASQARYERLRGMVELMQRRMLSHATSTAGGIEGSWNHWQHQTFVEIERELRTLLADGGEANDNEVEG